MRVNWGTVCFSKEKSGLGICSLSYINKALLEKRNWRFALEENFVWRSIISLKYDMEIGVGYLTFLEATMGSVFGRIFAKKRCS